MIKLSKKIKTCSFPKSNFSLTEQVSSIVNTVSLFKTSPFDISFLSFSFEGVSFNNFIFAEEGPSSNKVKTISNFSIDSLSFIFSQLSIIPINRLFSFSSVNNLLTIHDHLLNKSYEQYIQSSDFSFSLDSRFFYIFKLNKKTLSSKSSIFIVDNYFLILFKRKNRTFLFGYSLN